MGACGITKQAFWVLPLALLVFQTKKWSFLWIEQIRSEQLGEVICDPQLKLVINNFLLVESNKPFLLLMLLHLL